MKICPFCGKSFEYKDLLFFGEMKASGITPYVQEDQSQTITDYLSTPSIFGVFSDSPAEPSVVEENQDEAAAVGDDIYGVWREDDVYNEFINTFHGSKDIRKSRFIVKWSASESIHGIAQVTKWLDPDSEQIPFAVSLCDEDSRKYAKDARIRTLTRIMCPQCHCEINLRYLNATADNCHTAVLIGGKRCGKTQYRIAMMQNLRQFIATEYGLCDRIELFSASEEFFKVEEAEFMGAYAPKATQVALLFPLVFEICPTDNINDRKYVSIYDLPGEAFDTNGNPDAKSYLMENEGIKKADSALFIIDPAQLHESIATKFRTETIPIPEKSDTEEDSEVLNADEMVSEKKKNGISLQFYTESNITIPLQVLQEVDLNNSIKRIAVVVGKADLLFDVPTSKFNTSRGTLIACNYDDCHEDGKMQGHKKGVYLPCINQVSNNVIEEIVMSKSGGAEAVTAKQTEELKASLWKRVGITEENVENDLKFFAVSTFEYKQVEVDMSMDGSPSEEKKIVYKYIPCVEASMNRHRILEPMLYLLAKWKVVPVKNVVAASDPGPDSGPKPKRCIWDWLTGKNRKK